MYDIGEQVQDWLAAKRPVTLVRVIEIRGISSRDRSHVAAMGPDGTLVGSLLAGSADDQLAELRTSDAARLVEIDIGDDAAARAGLSCGGVARLIVQPAVDLPADVWQRLAAREPVCLVTRVEDDAVGPTELFTPATVSAATPAAARLFARGSSETRVVDEDVITALWPVPRLVVVGDGLIADALVASAALLGWGSTVIADADADADAGLATAAVADLATGDGVVVLSHSREVDGPALSAALAGQVGYIGALGSRHTQAARAEWLAAHGVTDLSRIHGPAGLDIGADTPAEIALSIAAEMLAVRSGAPAGSLRDRGGPVHPGGVQAPPPRYAP